MPATARTDLNEGLQSLESDLAELGSDSPQQITFYLIGSNESFDVPCVPGTLTDADRLIDGGFESAARCVVLVRIGNFVTIDLTTITIDSTLFTIDNSTPRPTANKICVFRGVTYRILSLGEDATRSYLRLLLGPDHI